MDGQRSGISIHQKLTKHAEFLRRSPVGIAVQVRDFARYRHVLRN